MTKRAEHSTRLDEEPKHKNPPDLTPETGRDPNDARHDAEQLARNQRELGVSPDAESGDHKTRDMERGGRGTFP